MSKNFCLIQSIQDSSSFIPTDEYRKNGETKPTKVTFKRSTPNGEVTYEVYDSVETFHRKDWDRVAVVFTSGQEWQFRGWKWEKPVDIFHHVVGICLKYHDEPSPGLVNQWKVQQLNVVFLM